MFENINKILNRVKIELKLKDELRYFEANKSDLSISRGFYVYGNPGVGKTEFVKKILKDLNYDIIYYDASEVRNKQVIENLTNKNMSDINVLSLLKRERKKIVIVMDEIDGLSNGDKSSLSNLIKLIRGKKTKKQKHEEATLTPIICIGNYQSDKKIKELINVCNNIELKQPSDKEISKLLISLMPKLEKKIIQDISKYIDGDLRKVRISYDIYMKQDDMFKKELLNTLFQNKLLNEDTKKITRKLLNEKIKFENHHILMNETDRTSVSLLFHENIVDVLEMRGLKKDYYIKLLERYCYADYIDRVTFQKQIWTYNEISSYMKTIHNNNDMFNEKDEKEIKPYNKEIRFTKILTKYSTEYNNQLFIQKMCLLLNLDKKDLISNFKYLREKYNINEIIELLNTHDVTELDINRMYRFIENM